MADFEGMAQALQIPQKVINNIDAIDKKINQIASDSEKMATHFMSAMQRMGDGSGSLLKRLTEIQSVLSALGSGNIGGMDRISSGMRNTATEAENAANNISKAAYAVNNFGNSGKNIAELRRAIKEANDELRKGEGIRPFANQQNVVDYRKQLQDELKEQETANQEKIRREQEADTRAYNNWLKLKDQEVRESQKAEEKKLRDRQKAINQYLKQLEQQAAAQARLDSRMRRSNYTDYVTSTEGSLRTADKATTYNQRAQAIKNLESAIKRLNSTDKDYQNNLSRLSAAHKKLIEEQKQVESAYRQVQQSQRHLMDTSGQLQRALAAIFSVSAIEGYINKLVAVRGEFELQNTALASILGNKEQADKLFGQITQLAVQSPFTVKELTTYTKSLAAYSVEYKDLYKTTKMLADVSSGLGVDMQRLILAFGQVKAANFLRGCLGYNTPVMLYDGSIKKVQDVVVGDILINEKGDPVNVLELIRGRETMFLVEQVSGRNRTSYRVNRNHILTLWNVQEQRLEDVYVYNYLKNKDAYLGLKIVDEEKVYYDIEVTKDRIDDYYGFVLDGNKRFRLGDGTITHNTETRQFTEAGINMLGELAKYYSELEGRIVSVSEVQDRQFKRMISFEDVAEVFKRLTSEGGMFYNMQERQAETLAGLMSNLQDRIDLMLNSLGQENEEMIKGVVKALGSLISNYETVANVIQVAGGAFVLFKLNALASSDAVRRLAVQVLTFNGAIPKTLSLVQLFQVGMFKLTTSLRAAGVAMKTFLVTNWPVLAITGLIAAIYELIHWNDEYNEQLKEINARHNEQVVSLNRVTKAYKKAADAAKEVPELTADSDAYKEQLNQLNELYSMMEERGYKVPVEIEYVTPENINDAFAQGSELLKQGSEFGQALRAEIARGMTDAELGGLIGENLKSDLEDLGNAYSKVDGAFKVTLNTIQNAFLVSEKLPESAQKYVEELEAGQKANEDDYHWTMRRLDLLRKMNHESGLQLSMTTGYHQQFNELLVTAHEAGVAEREAAYELDKVFDRLIRDYGGLDKLKKAYAENPILIQTEIDQAFESYQLNAQAERFAQFWAAQRLQIPFEWKEKEEVTGPQFFNDFRDSVQELDTTGIFRGMLKDMRSLEDLENAIQKKYKERSEELEVLQRANTKNLDLTKQIAKYQEQLLSPDAEIAANARAKVEALTKQKQLTEEQRKSAIEFAQTELQSLRNIANAYNLRYQEPKKTGSGSKKDPELERLKEQISLIEKAQKEYQKYQKLYDDTTAQDMTEKAFEQAFNDLGLNFDINFEPSGIIEAFKKLMESVGDEGDKLLNERIAVQTTGVTEKQRTQQIEEYREEIDKLFDSYENFQELEKLGLPKSTISQLFGIDVSSLNDVESNLSKIIEALRGYGEEGEKVIEDAESQLNDARKKELENHLKAYYGMLKNSISERVRIEIEAQKAIAAVQANDKLSPETKTATTKYIRQQADIKIGKVNWEEFQNSGVYQQLFQDLEYMSTASINNIKAKLDELKESMGELSPENLKALNEYYSKIQDELSSRNPFAAMLDSLQKINELQSKGLTESKLQEDLMEKETEKSTYEQEISDLETIISMKELGLSLDSLDASLLERNRSILALSTEELRKQVNAKQNSLNKTNGDISALQQNLQVYSEARQNVSKLGNTFQQVKKLGSSAFDSISEIMESMGKGMSENDKIIADMTGGLLDLVAQAVMFGLQLQLNTAFAEIMGTTINAALGPIGWAVMALQALTMIFTAFSKMHDNKIQEQIEAEEEKIDALQKSYERLEKTIENGLTIWKYSRNSELTTNLYSQIESRRKQIELEKDKKESDSEQIKEWQDEILDLYDELEDRFNETKTELIGDFKDVASQLADSLATAFEEGTSAARSWGEAVNQIVRDIILNFLTAKLIEPKVQELLDEWYSMVMPATSKAEDALEEAANIVNAQEKSFYEWAADMRKQGYNRPLPSMFRDYNKYKQNYQAELNRAEKEAAEAAEEAVGEIPNITDSSIEYLKNGLTDLFDSVFGDELTSLYESLFGGTDSLTGLQKGIQGITEDTAEVLASIVESIRFYVGQTYTAIESIRSWIFSPPSESPLYREMVAQTEQLRLLYSLVNSTTKTKNGVSGRILKVEIV